MSNLIKSLIFAPALFPIFNWAPTQLSWKTQDIKSASIIWVTTILWKTKSEEGNLDLIVNNKNVSIIYETPWYTPKWTIQDKYQDRIVASWEFIDENSQCWINEAPQVFSMVDDRVDEKGNKITPTWETIVFCATNDTWNNEASDTEEAELDLLDIEEANSRKK